MNSIFRDFLVVLLAFLAFDARAGSGGVKNGTGIVRPNAEEMVMLEYDRMTGEEKRTTIARLDRADFVAELERRLAAASVDANSLADAIRRYLVEFSDPDAWLAGEPARIELAVHFGTDPSPYFEPASRFRVGSPGTELEFAL